VTLPNNLHLSYHNTIHIQARWNHTLSSDYPTLATRPIRLITWLWLFPLSNACTSSFDGQWDFGPYMSSRKSHRAIHPAQQIQCISKWQNLDHTVSNRIYCACLMLTCVVSLHGKLKIRKLNLLGLPQCQWRVANMLASCLLFFYKCHGMCIWWWWHPPSNSW
jgi:hypothetical protein